ncbi:alpha/beta hydrolase-fold protein [Planococcus sp. S3-L1]|uniref:alpha/beta hydrolase n=1 Tax=Planococcus sp. S3-L1 TaxID=3046200 RepID=UPI0024B93205|nr:alpha/beta hydrolase-fold protein [Planococcus sp. S3-L1]MDJ0332267.1 alpha/beta hydrolase-fold protein [Planococcus sp. S3-L1]
MMDIFSITSEKLQDNRMIRVSIPKDYRLTNKQYPVLYMHDGQNVFRNDTAIGGMSLELEHYLDINNLDIIVVAIDQNSKERKNEYCPWRNGAYSKQFLEDKTTSFGGNGASYIQFIVQELKPYIDKTYRTKQSQTAMAGISLGGLITLYAACIYPHIFTNIILFSAGFYANQEKIEELIDITDLSVLTSLYMDCGTSEAGSNSTTSHEFLVSNQRIAKKLNRKCSVVTFNILEGEKHNYLSFQKRVPELFSFLQNEVLS